VRGDRLHAYMWSAKLTTILALIKLFSSVHHD